MNFQTYSLLKILALFFNIILLLQIPTYSQVSKELSNVKVSALTDQQIRNFIAEYDRLALSDAQFEDLVIKRGMNPDEVVKLKERMRAVRKALMSEDNSSLEKFKPLLLNASDSDLTNIKLPFDYLNRNPGNAPKNFGFDVFHNNQISFEPNLKLPTPKNYQLAADDELIVEVSGYSEASYHLKVSPEGIIRIPVAGPVFVNGLTIEQAKKIIIKKLANTIYSNIKTGRTSVEVYLGTIRSIKVTIIGEATVPGTYTLPSLATAYTALYACGGPNANGSFRNIQVIRNNNRIATIDVYRYLVNGSKENDVRLMDGDVIKINPYSVRIELSGEIKKTGLFDVAPNETVGTIIDYAGGFTDNAYTDKIQVLKNTSKERQVTTVTPDELQNLKPQKGDIYIVGKILNRFTNRISIKGAVFRPGEYELKNGMTLLQLIQEADGIREDAFTGRAIIHRYKSDLSPEIISVDLEKLFNNPNSDIPLKREDRVNIFSKFDLKEGYYVTIEGEVSSPGIFLYEEGLTVEDLIVMAGGLKESASTKRVEISRRVKDANIDSANIRTALIFQKDISTTLKEDSTVSKITLHPFDEVSIRVAPGYFEQKNVVAEGEILYGGKYTLTSKSDRISDLIKRAGGLTPEAYLNGAVLVRTKNFTKTEQNNNEQGLINLLKQNLESGTPSEQLQLQLQLITQKRSENVGIDLQRILESPKSKYDLLLNDGDTLRIPKQLQTVRVSGEVLYPALVRYNTNYSFKDYVNGAGGFSDRSLKKRSYVVHANGSVEGTHSFLFVKNYPSISPGAEIFVPTKRQRERLRTGEVITVGATVVSMFAILFSVLKK